ncbi:RNA polymerase I-specific transcription initiation factor RRN3-like isoform X3 [Amphibalanus amphitrite]|uniref:RNA polymerase I-specific transcription initiation factor RRN3-like isoform X3 n=1 Tax=Amphibalanus amphitrite TaxID=1232801 RepID=UPI001C8FEC19|nr:RNA polymerase I-specific transcription initiation factor RRN3-like isoform X3 [Amphibalanus amphitrite]
MALDTWRLQQRETMALPQLMSPSILRRADSAKKSLSVTFEDSVPFDLKSVLQEADQGNTGPYDELCQEIAKGIMQLSRLSEVLEQLHSCAGELCAERHVHLVRAVLACSWHHLPEPALLRYFSVVVLLATSQPHSATDAIKVLVHALQFVSEPDPLREEPFAGDLTDEERRIHTLSVQSLAAILGVIPMAQEPLLQTIQQRTPYLKKSARSQAAFFSSVLRLAALLPSARLPLLRLVYQRLVRLDLLCPRDQLAAAAAEAAEDAQTPGEEGDGEGKEEGGAAAADAPDEAVTLDAIMTVTLRHMETVCYPDGAGQLDWPATKLLYADLIKVFEEVALPTPSTAHAQFVLFWLAGRRLALAEHLIDWLWRRVQNPQAAAVLRQTAALYLGSFLARAKIVNINLVQSSLQVMCGWVHRYLTQQDSAARERADFSVHRPFYAVCQTVFYVFAFRHTEMPPNETYLPFLRSLNYERMVTSQLNPLRFCLPAVVQNFANVARHYQLAYCYTVIERNNRIRIPVVVSTAFGLKRLSAEQLYSSYFPFDPYLLKHSASFIKPCYREYEGDPIDSDSESDSEDDEMEADAAAAAASLEFSYAVSPGFKH